MALAKISLSSTDPPLICPLPPVIIQSPQASPIEHSWLAFLSRNEGKREKEIESKQNHIQHIYTITKHIKYVLGRNNIDCSKIYPSFICAVLSLEKLLFYYYYYFAEMCYIYIYIYIYIHTDSISQKWVHPSHFCKYFIIFFSCDNTEEMKQMACFSSTGQTLQQGMQIWSVFLDRKKLHTSWM